jgi:predicted aspartyl protease
MITGIVNADFEPIIPLSICGSDGKVYAQEAIVDNGFNGWLVKVVDTFGCDTSILIEV